jgi:hypothetical protein
MLRKDVGRQAPACTHDDKKMTEFPRGIMSVLDGSMILAGMIFARVIVQLIDMFERSQQAPQVRACVVVACHPSKP